MATKYFTSYKKEILAAIAKATDKALTEIGEKAVEYAKDKAAVDTGNMKASIVHERVDTNSESIMTSNDVAPIKDVHYSVFVEFGTRKMSAQPFIRPAAEDHMDEYAEMIVKELPK